jgi:DNA-binding response OmpR family regulator
LVIGEEHLGGMLADYLSAHGMQVSQAQTLSDGLVLLNGHPIGAVLVAADLPDAEGLLAIARVREKTRAPIIVLKPEGDSQDFLPALRQGAKDYLRYPLDRRDLLSRLQTVLFHHGEAASTKLRVGDIEADRGTRIITVRGSAISVTGIEFDLLMVLLGHAGEVVTREKLLSEAGRSDVVVGARTVDVHISHLRRKLGERPGEGQRIRSVRGVGYVLTAR